jgi:hypothetical protein
LAKFQIYKLLKMKLVIPTGDGDEAYALLMAEITSSILHWEEQGWIAGNSGSVDARACQIME